MEQDSGAMFYLIGIGLKVEHLTQEALSAINSCDEVYLESYTSTYAEGSRGKLEDFLGKNVKELKRSDVEEKFNEILENAKEKDVALLVFGNPLTATTHLQLLLDAKQKAVECKVVMGLSIFDFLGASGLDKYKFGRTTTIVYPSENYSPTSFYDMIKSNYDAGLHTLCLLDIKREGNKMMSISEAIEILEKIEKEKNEKILDSAVLVGISAAGSHNQKILARKASELRGVAFKNFPQCLVVCGKLNEKEIEGLKALSGYRG